MYERARILTAGEGALVAEFSDRVEPAANEAVRRLDSALTSGPGGTGCRCLGVGDRRRWLIGTVPTMRSLLVVFDPFRVRRHELAARLEELAAAELAESVRHPGAERETGTAAGTAGPARTSGGGRGRTITIPVCYATDLAPDLAEVAQLTGLSPQQVIAEHTAGEYLVYMIGFQIGQPYLASLPASLRLPRLQQPRLRTPLGAVAVAGELTGVYSLASPGGWRVLGTSPWPMFDLGWDPPTLLRAGDRVRFVAVDRARFDELRADPAIPAGIVTPAPAAGGADEAPASPALRVVNPGPMSTVQDLGRPGYGRYGVGPGGAMDRFALRVGNRLLGNTEGAAGVEVTGGGAIFEFLSETAFAWTGTTGPITIDGIPAPTWTVLSGRPGQRLTAGPPERGLRGYLCLGGGVAARAVLGSRSTNLAAGFGGPFGRACRPGDELQAYEHGAGPRKESAPAEVIETVYLGLPANERDGKRGAPAVSLRLVPGLQQEMLGKDALSVLFAGNYTVGPDSNRMGYRLVGPQIASRGGYDIVSDGLVEGAVQVPGSGRPVLLMADHQTTGGYPKPGVVAGADIPLAAQLSPGMAVRFLECSVDDALSARLKLEHAVAAAGGRLIDLELRVAGVKYSVQVDVLA